MKVQCRPTSKSEIPFLSKPLFAWLEILLLQQMQIIDVAGQGGSSPPVPIHHESNLPNYTC